jgi:hypothetical protein
MLWTCLPLQNVMPNNLFTGGSTGSEGAAGALACLSLCCRLLADSAAQRWRDVRFDIALPLIGLAGPFA